MFEVPGSVIWELSNLHTIYMEANTNHPTAEQHRARLSQLAVTVAVHKTQCALQFSAIVSPQHNRPLFSSSIRVYLRIFDQLYSK